MSLNNQPVRGIIPVLCVIISSIIFIGIGQSTFGINPDMLSVYALFFVWTAFIVSLAGDWPLAKIRQPLRGISYLAICLVIGVLHPLVISWLGYGPETYWPLISNLFLGIGIIIAFDNPLVNGFSQPKAVFFNTLFCYVFAIILMAGYGFVPSIWFAMFVYYFFWVEKWPLQQIAQPVKGILAFTVLGFLSLIFWQAYSMAGTSFFKPEGRSLLCPLCMVARYVLMEYGDVAVSEGCSAGKRYYRSHHISGSDKSIIYRNLEGSWDRSRHRREYRLDLCLLALYMGYRPCQMASGSKFRAGSEFRADRAYNSINGFASSGGPKFSKIGISRF